jgi:hypothetical protein
MCDSIPKNRKEPPHSNITVPHGSLSKGKEKPPLPPNLLSFGEEEEVLLGGTEGIIFWGGVIINALDTRF